MKALLFALLLSTTLFAENTFTTKAYRSLHAMGLKRTPKSIEYVKKARRHVLRGAEVVPGKVDLSPIVSPPEDQGQCGSCWDFSLTKALRSSLMIAGTDPGVLAFNYLLNNCGPGPSQSGCNGGDFDAGESFLNNSGPWFEKEDPYRESEGRCKQGLKVEGTALEFIAVGSNNNSPTFQELASALSQKHMMSIDVAVCGSWRNYGSGIFNQDQCGQNSINHMINLVGYDCETSVDAQGNCVFDSNGQPKNGDGYLKVMNNWGESWGENGYMRTRYGVDAVATTAMYFVVKTPQPSPTPTPVPTPPAPTPTPVPPVPVPDGQSLPVWVYFAFGGAGILILFLGIVAFSKH